MVLLNHTSRTDSAHPNLSDTTAFQSRSLSSISLGSDGEGIIEGKESKDLETHSSKQDGPQPCEAMSPKAQHVDTP